MSPIAGLEPVVSKSWEDALTDRAKESCVEM